MLQDSRRSAKNSLEQWQPWELASKSWKLASKNWVQRSGLLKVEPMQEVLTLQKPVSNL
jgi:hypothetical protein